MSRHHDKVICVTGGGVLAAASPTGGVLEQETGSLLGRGGQSFGTQVLTFGERLLEGTGGEKVLGKQRQEARTWEE